MITCTALTAISVTIIISIIVLDKTCHTVPMMLTANSCLAAILVAFTLLSMSVFTLQSDLQHNYIQDSFCLLRLYFADVANSWFIYSFLIQAIYRYVTVIYPNRLFFQSMKYQALFIFVTWMFGIVYPFVYMFNGEVKYNVDNQICQRPLQLSFYTIYGALCIYVVPVPMVLFIYFKLVRYVKQMSKRITPVNTLSRAKRELKMVQRTAILIIILGSIGFPYMLFMTMSFFNTIPKYHFRIGFLFYDVSLIFVIIILFQLTDPLKEAIMKKFKRRINVLVATVA